MFECIDRKVAHLEGSDRPTVPYCCTASNSEGSKLAVSLLCPSTGCVCSAWGPALLGLPDVAFECLEEAQLQGDFSKCGLSVCWHSCKPVRRTMNKDTNNCAENRQKNCMSLCKYRSPEQWLFFLACFSFTKACSHIGKPQFPIMSEPGLMLGFSKCMTS